MSDLTNFQLRQPKNTIAHRSRARLPVWRTSHRAVLARYTDAREPELHKLIIRDIIDREVHDLVATSAESIAESGVQSADDVRCQNAPLIRYSDELAEANRASRK